jgi:2-aminoethylphosphonate-pyruvate transaminase
VAGALAAPPCNYHRQSGFEQMFAETETDLKLLLGIREPSAYFAIQITSTGTGANEACLDAMAGLGPGAVVSNGFFGQRVAAQAAQAGVDHVVIEQPGDRPLDPDAVAAAIDARGDLRWLFFISHETRVGLVNPLVDIGKLAAERGLFVTADVISSAYAYPLDLEAAGIDLAVASSAKALMAAPGIGIVIARRAAIETLRATRRSSYYLDLVAELDKQSQTRQPRFAQPVALHASIRAACSHLREVGIDAHMARIRRQLAAVADHLAGIDIAPLIDPALTSGVVANFRLPAHIRYPEFTAAMLERGYYLLYGIPGDESHFQVSTIGDLTDEHVAGLNATLAKVLR